QQMTVDSLFVPIKFFVRKPSPFRKVRGIVVNVERRRSYWPADSAQTTQGNSKPESRNAFWSNVKVQEQPALVPSAAMTASANEPCPSLSAIIALKTSGSFSTTSTSV